MNRIVAPTEGQPIEAPAPAAKTFTVLSPVGTPPKITRKTAAPRLESLDGKTIYLVDCRFDDSIELLKQVAAWFAAHMPNVKTRIVSLSATYQKDDPKTWNEIKANGDAAIIGVGHCSNCAPAVTTHAITLETKYGVPTVALHTDKFDRGGGVGRQDGGAARGAALVRAAAGDGQDGGRARRLRQRQRPDHRPAGDAGGSPGADRGAGRRSCRPLRSRLRG